MLHIQAADHPLAATNGAACHLLDPDLVDAGSLHLQPAGKHIERVLPRCSHFSLHMGVKMHINEKDKKKKKRKDYAFRCQFNEKPNITPGCTGAYQCTSVSSSLLGASTVKN